MVEALTFLLILVWPAWQFIQIVYYLIEKCIHVAAIGTQIIGKINLK